jgi:hypothetical protein
MILRRARSAISDARSLCIRSLIVENFDTMNQGKARTLRNFALGIGVSFLILMPSAASAAEERLSDGITPHAKAFGQAVKRDSKAIGAACKEGATRVASAAKSVAHEISAAARRGAVETRAALRGGKTTTPTT